MPLSQEDFAKLATNLSFNKEPIDVTSNPSFVDRASSVIKKAGSEVQNQIAGKENLNENPLKRGVKATAAAFSAPIKLAFEALPEPARNALKSVGDFIGKGIKSVTDYFGSNPTLQKWTQDHPDAYKALTNTLATTAGAGEIAGDILAINGLTQSLSKAVGKKAADPAIVDELKNRVNNSQAMDVQGTIAKGGPDAEMLKSTVYKPGTNIVTPEFAQGRISDIAKKLDAVKPGLGDTFKKGIDINNLTMDGNVPEALVSKANSLIDQYVANPSGVIGLATKTGEAVVKPIKGLGTKIADATNPIETGVQTELNPTRLIPKENLRNIPIENIQVQQASKAAKLNEYAKTAEQAVNDFSKPTPLAVAGDKGGDALQVLNNKLAKQGMLKQEALAEVGSKPVSNISEFRAGLKDSLRKKVGINLDTQSGQIVPATGRASKIALDSADNKLVKDVIGVFDSLGEKPTVQMIDDAIDSVQDILYKRKSNLAVPINGQVEGVLKEFTGKLNSAVKKVAGEQYTKANAKYSYFVDVRDQLNKALGAEGVRGASLMKSLFSPTGEAPRRLFEEVKKLTGIDLVEEATFAKYVMENVGDARQASLLEEIIKNGSVSPKSFVGSAFKQILKKGQDPIKRAQDIIKQNTGK